MHYRYGLYRKCYWYGCLKKLQLINYQQFADEFSEFCAVCTETVCKSMLVLVQVNTCYSFVLQLTVSKEWEQLISVSVCTCILWFNCPSVRRQHWLSDWQHLVSRWSNTKCDGSETNQKPSREDVFSFFKGSILWDCVKTTLISHTIWSSFLIIHAYFYFH